MELLEQGYVADGLYSKWIGWVMNCVSTVSWSVTVNGQHYGFTQPQRGLRQGDPLSPYLFLLCAEGLSSLVKVRERQGLISGVKISRGGPTISHLLFVDDYLIFCKAVKEESEW